MLTYGNLIWARMGDQEGTNSRTGYEYLAELPSSYECSNLVLFSCFDGSRIYRQGIELVYADE